MAITVLSTPAPEEGTYTITLEFSDEDGTDITPETMFWSLMDRDRNIINNRLDQEITVLSTSATIVLTGDDLAITSNSPRGSKRRFTLIGTYDSDLGTDLPFTAECEFTIQHFVGVPTVVA